MYTQPDNCIYIQCIKKVNVCISGGISTCILYSPKRFSIHPPPPLEAGRMREERGPRMPRRSLGSGGGGRGRGGCLPKPNEYILHTVSQIPFLLLLASNNFPFFLSFSHTLTQPHSLPHSPPLSLPSLSYSLSISSSMLYPPTWA